MGWCKERTVGNWDLTHHEPANRAALQLRSSTSCFNVQHLFERESGENLNLRKRRWHQFWKWWKFDEKKRDQRTYPPHYSSRLDPQTWAPASGQLWSNKFRWKSFQMVRLESSIQVTQNMLTQLGPHSHGSHLNWALPRSSAQLSLVDLWSFPRKQIPGKGGRPKNWHFFSKKKGEKLWCILAIEATCGSAWFPSLPSARLILRLVEIHGKSPRCCRHSLPRKVESVTLNIVAKDLQLVERFIHTSNSDGLVWTIKHLEQTPVERQALAGGKRAKVVCRSMPLLVSCSSCESHSIGTIQKVAYSIGTIQKVVACFRRFKKKEEEEEERKKKIIYVFLNEKKEEKMRRRRRRKKTLRRDNLEGKIAR